MLEKMHGCKFNQAWDASRRRLREGVTDLRTNRRTDGRTDRPSYRDGRTQLKMWASRCVRKLRNKFANLTRGDLFSPWNSGENPRDLFSARRWPEEKGDGKGVRQIRFPTPKMIDDRIENCIRKPPSLSKMLGIHARTFVSWRRFWIHVRAQPQAPEFTR